MVISLLGVLLGLAGLVFGYYQWRRQHGDVRLDVQEGNRLGGVRWGGADIRLRLVVNAAMAVEVHEIFYEVTGLRHRIRRIRQQVWTERGLWQNLRNMWAQRHRDIAWGLFEPVPAKEAANLVAPHLRPMNPIGGPLLPTRVSGYNDVTWVLFGADYADYLRRLLDGQPGTKPRIRFGVAMTGHPRRTVASRWLKLASLEMFDPFWAGYVANPDRGLPQFSREGPFRPRWDGVKDS